MQRPESKREPGALGEWRVGCESVLGEDWGRGNLLRGEAEDINSSHMIKGLEAA